jgi:hypothetical protein
MKNDWCPNTMRRNVINTSEESSHVTLGKRWANFIMIYVIYLYHLYILICSYIIALHVCVCVFQRKPHKETPRHFPAFHGWYSVKARWHLLQCMYLAGTSSEACNKGNQPRGLTSRPPAWSSKNSTTRPSQPSLYYLDLCVYLHCIIIYIYVICNIP